MGIEPPANSPENTAFPAPGGAQSGALAPAKHNIDPGLAALAAALQALPPEDRARLAALLTGQGQGE
jgi:hypothetical protein